MFKSESSIPDIGSSVADLDPSTDRYAARFAGPTGEWLLSVQTKALRKLIAPWPKARVLDVGGGHGQVAGPLLEDGHEVTVLASSQAAYGRAALLRNPRPQFVTGNLSNPPFPDQSFDIVVSVRMMAHVGDWQSFLSGLCRVARDAVIVDFPIPGGFNVLEPVLFGLKKRLEGDTRRFDRMDKSEVSDALAINGFQPMATIGQFVLPMVFHRKLRVPSISKAVEHACHRTGLASAIGTPVILCATRRSKLNV